MAAPFRGAEGCAAPKSPRGPSVSPSVHLLPFADGAVLFRSGTRHLWVLNAASAYVWCLLDGDEEMDALVAAYARRFGVDDTVARGDVTRTLGQLRQDGLIGDEGPAEAEACDGDPPAVVEPLPWHDADRWPVRQRFDAQGELIEFLCSDRDIGAAFGRLMAPLRSSRTGVPGTRLAVIGTGADAPTYDVVLNGHHHISGATKDAVLPYLFTLVFVRTSAALRHRLLFHAAAVGRNGRVVLLPGESGSGKTTLAAALAARGWQFFTDELVAMDVAAGTVRPLPLPMSIKPGAVGSLLSFYPELATAPVHTRADGKRVRYLLPPGATTCGPWPAGRVRLIVFPRYTAGAETRLAAIDKADALHRLAAAGSSDRPLRHEDVAAMVTLVETSVCRELVLSNLGQGVAAVEAAVVECGGMPPL